MDLYDKLKRFLGLPRRQDRPPFDDQDRNFPPPPSSDDDFQPRLKERSFNVFTDPVEMHKYFEAQMEEMLQNFGFNNSDGDGFSHNFHFPQVGESNEEFGWPELGQIPDDDNVQSGDLRDQFLKYGYEKPQIQGPEERGDKDIDDKLDISDWDSVFNGGNSVTPYQRQVTPRTRFFSQSVTSKSIRNPDGSVETHRTIRDNEGNEETTIKKKIGDKEYIIIKKRDKSGKEETIENWVNLDEKDFDKFFTKKLPQLDESPQQPWPFFDRFFK